MPRTKNQLEKIRVERSLEIENTAMRLFAEFGYDTTSISMIAKEACISKGLIYNYFDSKEQLLSSIIEKIYTELMNIMNPNHDDEITTQEMTDFFSFMIDLFHDKKEYWKLYFQVSTQKDVLELLSKPKYNEMLSKNKALIYRYFNERFDNPELEMFVFISLMKGFAMRYAFAPDNAYDSLLEDFKNKMKYLFIRESRLK